MGAEDVKNGLTPLLGIFRQMEKFVGATKTHRGRRASKVLDSIFQPFLPQPLLGGLVGFRLLLRSFGLRVGGVFHRLGALVRSESLQGEQNTPHPDAEKLQDLVLFFQT